jgi:serine/threonine protein kinase
MQDVTRIYEIGRARSRARALMSTDRRDRSTAPPEDAFDAIDAATMGAEDDALDAPTALTQSPEGAFDVHDASTELTGRRNQPPARTDFDVPTSPTRGTLPGPARIPRQPTPVAYMAYESNPPTSRQPTPVPHPAAVHSTAYESDPPTSILLKGNFVELPPGAIVGEVYEIDAKIGRGAMGEVYAARHIKLGKRVAIKVIGEALSEDPAAIERFSQEARTLAQIQHPAIVAVDHVGELADGRAYFVMELLRGESLFSHLQREQLPLPQALHVLDQIARGLEAAHAQGIVHRDLKPENIFLTHVADEAPIVKLLDFGLSKLINNADRRAERTQSGAAIGTPMYMSPEQMRGPDVDHRTDIYALGCIAYELVLGSVPFPHAETAPELYAAHLHEAPQLPRSIWPEIPPQLDLALFAMLAKDADHRPTLVQVRSMIADTRTDIPSRRASTEFVAWDSARSPASPRTGAIALATLLIGLVFGALATRYANKSPDTAPSVTTIDASTSTTAPVVTVPIAETPVVAVPITEAPKKSDVVASAAARARSSSSSGSATAIGSARVVAPVLPPKAEVAPKPDPAEIVMPDAGVDATNAVVEDARAAPLEAPSRPRQNDRNQTLNPFDTKKNSNP